MFYDRFWFDVCWGQSQNRPLIGKGFAVEEYNYSGCLSLVSHTIGYRSIEISDNTQTDNNSLLEGDNSFGYNFAGNRVSTVDVYSGTDSVNSISSFSADSKDIRTVSVLNQEESSSENSTVRPLVVIAVRGSVTFWDWLMDFLTQLHIGFFDFDVGAQMVIESLYGYDNCTECDKNDKKCPCQGYLVNNEIENPIILITGHSMGAAIANLVAAELNEIEGQADVYAYSFATPTVTSLPTTPYTNIFNILNTNDVVTYVPNSWLIPNINLWSRHGIDLPINMPYSETQDTNLLGITSHSMEVYMTWMESHEGITYSGMLTESAQARTRGILPWFVKIKCPVGVTVKDSEGNIIAYESQQEGITYPEITDTGIVSWIDEDGAKVFFVPHYADASKIEIDAYDYGNMTMSIGLLGAEETAPTDTADATEGTEETEVLDNSITYNNVNLYPGRAFDVAIPESTDEFDASDDIALVEVEVDETGNRTTVGEITDLNPLLKSVTVRNPVVNYGTATVIEVVTDKSATKIRFVSDSSGATITIAKDSTLVVSIVEDGDNLIWTVQRVFARGHLVYGVAVKVNKTWYPLEEKVFAVTVN